MLLFFIYYRWIKSSHFSMELSKFSLYIIRLLRNPISTYTSLSHRRHQVKIKKFFYLYLIEIFHVKTCFFVSLDSTHSVKILFCILIKARSIFLSKDIEVLSFLMLVNCHIFVTIIWSWSIIWRIFKRSRMIPLSKSFVSLVVIWKDRMSNWPLSIELFSKYIKQ
jgi:hypothetical protein